VTRSLPEAKAVRRRLREVDHQPVGELEPRRTERHRAPLRPEERRAPLAAVAEDRRCELQSSQPHDVVLQLDDELRRTELDASEP
jgi:hypothetical protein